MENDSIDQLIERIQSPSEPEAHLISKRLIKIGDEKVIKELLPLLYHENPEVIYLAVHTISQIKPNQFALEEVMQAIHDPVNKNKNGALVEALSGFDISAHFVDIFKLYLFGNFKVSAMAKLLLDFEEFDIVPRTIRKAEKHLKHFEHNMPDDAQSEVKRAEANVILSELRSLFD